MTPRPMAGVRAGSLDRPDRDRQDPENMARNDAEDGVLCVLQSCHWPPVAI